jgi:hypothetical protein
MSSSGSSEENSLTDIIYPYMRELKMHPKELSLKDGKVQIEDVRGPKGEGVLKLGWKSWSKKSLDTRRWRTANWTLSVG